MKRFNLKSPSKSSGPEYDKTTGKINISKTCQNSVLVLKWLWKKGEYGFYALCDARLLINEQNKCRMGQNVTVEKNSTKFEFWYFMFGSQIGSLELTINGSQVVWTKTGRQQNEWLLARLEIPAGSYYVKIWLLNFPVKHYYWIGTNQCRCNVK